MRKKVKDLSTFNTGWSVWNLDQVGIKLLLLFIEKLRKLLQFIRKIMFSIEIKLCKSFVMLWSEGLE